MKSTAGIGYYHWSSPFAVKATRSPGKNVQDGWAIGNIQGGQGIAAMIAPREAASPDRGAARPAEAFHPAVFILEELEARGWTVSDLAIRMGGDATVNLCALELYLTVGPTEKGILLGQFWLNLHEYWVKYG
jgi:hypothetical protein